MSMVEKKRGVFQMICFNNAPAPANNIHFFDV